MDVLNKIKAMIQWGRQSKKTDDSGRDQIAQVESTGSKPFSVVYVYPYGLSANAPTECNVLQFNMNGSAKGKTGIPSMMENRFRDLKEWEVVIGNYSTKAHLLFSESGDIHISPTSSESKDWAVQFTEMKAAFDQLRNEFNALVTAYNGHVHNVAALPSVGTPPPMIPTIVTQLQASSSTASMDGAKVEKVRLP